MNLYAQILLVVLIDFLIYVVPTHLRPRGENIIIRSNECQPILANRTHASTPGTKDASTFSWCFSMMWALDLGIWATHNATVYYKRTSSFVPLSKIVVWWLQWWASSASDLPKSSFGEHRMSFWRTFGVYFGASKTPTHCFSCSLLTLSTFSRVFYHPRARKCDFFCSPQMALTVKMI